MNDINKTVLIIDDEKVILLGVSAIMRKAGFKTITANNGVEGLKKAKENTPDIIICDVMMPPPNGFELKKLLSEDPVTADIPFIFVTARSTKSAKLTGLEAGADDYITKPFDREELLARVKAVLRRTEKSEKKGANSMRAEMENLRQQIMNTVSHELRTPMSGLMNTLELVLRSRYENPEEETRFISSALSNAYQLQRLIDDLIMLSTIDQEKINTFRQVVDLEFDLVKPAEKTLITYAGKGLQINFVFDEDVIIHAPRAEFKHVIRHLVDNACKFSNDQGVINVKVEKKGTGGTIITVSDDGIGIPKEEREKVFEKYYQVSKGDTRQFHGLGIGLTICRVFARAWGGDVVILDTQEGCKSQFTIGPAEADWNV
ncbi:MAG: hybrid sensor histidine kinase/response regulator [Bacteroidales bacterium]|nr:hybrid sensor histidine kinase/response regulator [Bacteroidales bacterium]